MRTNADPPELDDVTAFVRVARAMSFSDAARRSGVAKSNLSRRVARLEERLGVRLFERTTRKLRLTEAGARYFDAVAQALDQVDEAADVVRGEQETPAGRIRVTAPHDWAALGHIVPAFLRAYPHIELEIQLTQRRVDLVAEGFDVALRGGKLPDSDLVARRLDATEAHLFATPTYLETRGTPETIDDLADHDGVLFRARQHTQTLHLVGPDGPVEVEFRGRLSAWDFSFMRSVAVADGGIALLPDSLVRPDVERGILQMVLPAYRADFGAVYFVVPSARHMPAKVRVFRDFLLEQLGRRCPR